MDAFVARQSVSPILIWAVCLVTSTIAPAQTAPHLIRGSVVDPEGNPIAGATLSIGHVLSLFQRERYSAVKSEANGSFNLSVTYPGQATLSAWHPEYVSTTITADTEVESAIVMQPGTRLSGAIVGPKSLLSNAMVLVSIPQRGIREYVRTGERGQFYIGNLPAGRCAIEARAYSPDGNCESVVQTETLLLPDGANSTTLTLPTGTARLTGAAHFPNQQTRTATVTLRIRNNGGSYHIRTTSADDGTYHFQDLPVGSGELVLEANGFGSQLHKIDIAPGENSMPTKEMAPGATLKCTFLNIPNETEAVDFSIYFNTEERPRSDLAAIRTLLDRPTAWHGSLRDRTIEISELAPGRYTLVAFPLNNDEKRESVFRRAEMYLPAPAYVDRITIGEDTGRTTLVAASFPEDQRPAYSASQQPMHPIIGRWAYVYQGTEWSRIFTDDGYCQLMEGPLAGWRAPYVIVSESKVAVIKDGRRRMHIIRPDGKLDIVGRFVGTKD